MSVPQPVRKNDYQQRDLGYAIGALSAGLIADRFRRTWAITAIPSLTFVSGQIVAVVMQEAGKGPRQPVSR
jgi:hypothetical protein